MWSPMFTLNRNCPISRKYAICTAASSISPYSRPKISSLRRTGLMLRRRSTPLRRSAATREPPKIIRFMSRYITMIPGSDWLNPTGMGLRPANRASSVTGFGLWIRARKASSVGGAPVCVEAFSIRCAFSATSARTNRNSTRAAYWSSDPSILKNSTLTFCFARTRAVKSAGMRMPRLAWPAFSGATTLIPCVPSSSKKTRPRNPGSRFSISTAGRGLDGSGCPRKAKPIAYTKTVGMTNNQM